MALTRRTSRRSIVTPALGMVVLLLGARPGRAETPEAKDLRRGLVASFKATGRGQVVGITQLEPTIALALKAGEAPHPRLPSESMTVVWKGYLIVHRNGGYRFSARLRGEFRITIAGKDVLKTKSAEKEPELKDGDEVQLEAGMHPLVAEFERLPGAARLELLWQGPGFRQEPLPFNFVGHLPGKVPLSLSTDSLVEQGRFLFEEASCARCHRPDEKDHIANGLKSRQAPNLSKIGERAYAGWIEHWLKSPQKVRPEAAMPEMFTPDEGGRTERYAVARYLATLGGPVKPSPKLTKLQETIALADTVQGLGLFTRVGCVACHNPEGKPSEPTAFYGPRRNFSLHGLGSKTTPEKLAEFLKNPLAMDPSGRMPHLLLDDKEAISISRFLCQSTDETVRQNLGDAPIRGQLFAAFKRVEPRADEFPAFEKLAAPTAWADLGKRLVIAKGCNNCHTIEPENQPFAQVQANADLDDLKKLENPRTGCLAEKPDPKSPHFTYSNDDRTALRAFLKTGLTGAGSPSPAHSARTDLRRYNCLACHSRDGEGGLPTNIVDYLRQAEHADNAEAVSPPPLTGVAHKLRTPWMRQVFTGAGRARPWMSLRMPQFGAAQVGRLPEELAALEGIETDETIHKVAFDAKQIEAGRLLVGKTALGCISCHDMAGVASGGTRGPDLSLMNQRVRYDWYARWLEQAQRMQPGTRMPEVFIKGKSLFDGVYGGAAGPQAEAMWAYLAATKGAP